MNPANLPKRLSLLPALAAAALLPSFAGLSGEPLAAEEAVEAVSSNFFDAISGADANIGGFLFPHLHAFGAFGASSGNQAELASGHHDPQRNATLQSLEPGLSLRAGMLQGFVGGLGTTDDEGHFDFDLEEGFLKLVDLPFGLEARGGQYLNRFGFQNAVHNHGWMFVDQNLVNGRFLNEGELMTLGGELSWNVPLDFFQASVFSASVGKARTHDHGDHGHHHHHEAEFEAEGAEFNDLLVSANWVSQYDFDDMNRLTGVVSGAWGDNEFGRTSQVYGVGLEYLWRESGYNPGGNSFRWRTEAMIRSVGAVGGHDDDDDHHGHHGHHDEDHDDDDDHDHHEERERFDEFGIATMLVYGIDDRVEAGLRGEWVSGIAGMGLDERWRLSPMVTWYANQARTLQARLQYNWDYSNDFGSENSVWLQIGFNWGSPHVR